MQTDKTYQFSEVGRAEYLYFIQKKKPVLMEGRWCFDFGEGNSLGRYGVIYPQSLVEVS